LAKFVVACIDLSAYKKALSVASDNSRPLVSVALAMCSYSDDGNIDAAKSYLIPL